MGSEDFVEKVQTLLNTKATNREVTEMADKHALREQSARYNQKHEDRQCAEVNRQKIEGESPLSGKA